MPRNAKILFVCCYLTSKVISGWVPICEIVHLCRLYSAAPLWTRLPAPSPDNPLSHITLTLSQSLPYPNNVKRLARNRQVSIGHWFEPHEVWIPQSLKMRDGRSTHLAIPSGLARSVGWNPSLDAILPFLLPQSAKKPTGIPPPMGISEPKRLEAGRRLAAGRVTEEVWTKWSPDNEQTVTTLLPYYHGHYLTKWCSTLNSN